MGQYQSNEPGGRVADGGQVETALSGQAAIMADIKDRPPSGDGPGRHSTSTPRNHPGELR
ncbi:MAG: hypothetical protein WKF75_06340 [Singulisphaera sp.]